MAPEIFEGGGNKNYDYKCDLWSIGIIIYQLFFKEYPYKGSTPTAIYNQINTFGNKILKSTNNNHLDNLINSLLIRDPQKRINYEDYFNHSFFKDNHKPADEANTQNINKLILNSNTDKIMKFFHEMHSKGLVNDIIPIKKKGKVICQKLMISRNLLPKIIYLL